MTWDRRLYFLSEGSIATVYSALKNSSSAGFEPANLGPNVKHANHCITKGGWYDGRLFWLNAKC
jgi:hypothetical protein